MHTLSHDYQLFLVTSTHAGLAVWNRGELCGAAHSQVSVPLIRLYRHLARWWHALLAFASMPGCTPWLFGRGGMWAALLLGVWSFTVYEVSCWTDSYSVACNAYSRRSAEVQLKWAVHCSTHRSLLAHCLCTCWCCHS